MDRELNLFEAAEILDEYYITRSPQMISRWCREGRIKAFRSSNRKEGWRIPESSLYEFIDQVRPGLIEIMSCINGNLGNSKDDNSFCDHFGIPLKMEKDVTPDNVNNEESPLNKFNDLILQMGKTNEEINLQIAKFGKRLESFETKFNKFEEIKDNPNLSAQGDNEKVSVEKIYPELKMEYQEFKKLVEDEGFEHDIDEESIRKLYWAFFDKNEKLLSNIYSDELDALHCPITKKPRKISYFKGMLKRAIRATLGENGDGEEDNLPVNESENKRKADTEEVILHGSI